MHQQEVSTGIHRRARRPPEIGPVRPNFVLSCPDCGHLTGFLTLEPAWRCAQCRAQWRTKMCRRCHRHLAMGEEGPFCQDTLRCGAGSTATAAASR